MINLSTPTTLTTPTLRIKFSDGVGNVTDISYVLPGPTIMEVVEHMRYALLGMGFSEELVREEFRDESK